MVDCKARPATLPDVPRTMPALAASGVEEDQAGGGCGCRPASLLSELIEDVLQ